MKNMKCKEQEVVEMEIGVKQKNVVRMILQQLTQKSIDQLNMNKQAELKKILFVYEEDDSCNRNWDLFNFPEDKQAIAVQNTRKFWSELQ